MIPDQSVRGALHRWWHTPKVCHCDYMMVKLAPGDYLCTKCGRRDRKVYQTCTVLICTALVLVLGVGHCFYPMGTY